MNANTFYQDVYPLFTIDQLVNWPTIEWIVEDVIQPESLVAIFGQSRSGKSFFALDLASKIAKGEEWFGYKVNQRKVIYLAAEGIQGISNRIKAIKHTSSEAIGYSNLMFIKASIDLAKPEDIQRTIDTSYGKADVLIVDTFNAVTPGADENSSRDMGKILYGLRQIISECHCTVILVHHTGWDDKERMRGHSSLSAATDTRIHVKHAGGRRQWAVTGQRDGDVTNWHPFHLEPVELEEDEITSCIVSPIQESFLDLKIGSKTFGENQKLVHKYAIELFSENGNNPFSINDILQKVIPIINIPKKYKSTRIKEYINQLISKGLITVDDQGYITKVI